MFNDIDAKGTITRHESLQEYYPSFKKQNISIIAQITQHTKAWDK